MLQRTCRAFLLSSFLLACPLAAAAQPEEAPISVFGYFQSQFRYHDAAPFEDMATNSFVLQQMNLFLQKDLGKDLSALVNLEFLNSFSTTRATGALNVDEAWVRYRVGRML